MPVTNQGLNWNSYLSHTIWWNYSDLTRPHPKWWFSKGNHLISGKLRLVKYYNFSHTIHVWYICLHLWLICMIRYASADTPRRLYIPPKRMSFAFVSRHRFLGSKPSTLNQQTGFINMSKLKNWSSQNTNHSIFLPPKPSQIYGFFFHTIFFPSTSHLFLPETFRGEGFFPSINGRNFFDEFA